MEADAVVVEMVPHEGAAMTNDLYVNVGGDALLAVVVMVSAVVLYVEDCGEQ